MKHILDKLICEKQTGFLKNRFIRKKKPTIFIYDLIEQSKAYYIPGMLILLIFQKKLSLS